MIRATILGCGSSGGVPRIGPHWGSCDPSEPRNRRRRCALLVERVGPQGVTQVLIDTGPDFVPQMLDAGVSRLDAVLWTHSHADHIHGIDDLRQIAINTGEMVQGWADPVTAQVLRSRFAYVFEMPPGSSYPPVCTLNVIAGPVTIAGPGGDLTFLPFEVDHGNLCVLGFRVGGLVYLPDVLSIPQAAWDVIAGVEVFICDALRRKPHPSHAHLALTLEWLARSGARRGILTNMHLDMDYATLQAELPSGVEAAHDGMIVTL